MIKYLFDRSMALIGLICLWPVLLVVAILIKVKMPGGQVLFTQHRIGKDGKLFTMYKFRSMTMSHSGSSISVAGESRITPLGAVLRKYKLDELPQLFNVLKGDMSLVGPRPEVRKYVEHYTEEQRRVLSVRPGITDYASIEYVDENTILGQAEDADKVYVEQILPDKICYNMKYIEHRSVKEYFKIIFLTIWSIVH